MFDQFFRDFPKLKMMHFGKMQHFGTPQGRVKVRKFKKSKVQGKKFESFKKLKF